MNKQVRHYDKEFKDQAVRLYLSRDISLPKLGQELGIPSSTLASWVSHHAKGSQTVAGSGDSCGMHEEMMKMKKELSHLREEREILKKALAIFSKAKA
jgi:transposase